MKIYKAGEELDPLDQAYVQLRAALDAEDPAGVEQALGQLTTLANNGVDASTTKAARLDPVVAMMRTWLQ